MAGTEKPDQATPPSFPWFDADWIGPRIEQRPADAGADWPVDATYRVHYTLETVPGYPRSEAARFPFTEHFGEDGWPLCTPERLKELFPDAFRTFLHTYPLTINGPMEEYIWMEISADYRETTAERIDSPLVARGIDPDVLRVVLRQSIYLDFVKGIEAELKATESRKKP